MHTLYFNQIPLKKQLIVADVKRSRKLEQGIESRIGFSLRLKEMRADMRNWEVELSQLETMKF